MRWKRKMQRFIAMSTVSVLTTGQVPLLGQPWTPNEPYNIEQGQMHHKPLIEEIVEEVLSIPAREIHDTEKGLVAHYYVGDEEKDHICTHSIANGDDLSPGIKDARDCINFVYNETDNNAPKKWLKHVRYEGYICVQEDGEYTFGLSGNEQYFIKVGDNKIAGTKLEKHKKVRLKRNKWYELTVECSDMEKVNQMKLWWQRPHQTEQETIPQQALIRKNVEIKEKQKISNRKLLGRSAEAKSKMLGDNTTKIEKKPVQSPVNVDDNETFKVPTLLDSNGDGIPDEYSTKGFFVNRFVGGRYSIIPYEDRLGDIAKQKGMVKYVCSPFLWSTTGDPYSNYQKVMYDHIDGQVSKVARDPMVAAYPIVVAHIEQVMLSINKDHSTTEGGEKSNSKSTSTTDGTSKDNSLGGSVSVTAGYSMLQGASASATLTGTYQHSWGESHSDGKENGSSDSTNWSKNVSFNEGEAAAIAFGIRYENIGTAPIYGAKPTFTIYIYDEKGNPSVIYGTTVNEGQGVEVLYPNRSYPDKQQKAGIRIGQADEFNSSNIMINENQLKSYLKSNMLHIDSPQCIGNVKIIDQQNNFTEQKWIYYYGEIQARTAQLQLCIPGERGMTRRVAARDARVPNLESIPSLTIGEALERAYGMTAVGNGAYTFVKETGENEADEKYVFKNGFRIELDEKTKQKYKAQQAQTKDNDLMNFKLTPGATIKIIPNDGFVYNETKDIAYYYEKGELVKGPKSFGPESPPLLSKENDNKMNQPFVHQYVMKQKKEKHYYFDLKGHFWTGWRTDENGDRYYYAEESSDFEKGERVTGIREIAGKPYYFDEKDGRLKKQGWHRLFPVDFDVFASVRFLSSRLGDWYVREEGQLASGWQEINGKTYYFDPKNKYMLAIGKRVIDGKTYLFNAAGEHQLKEGQRHEVEKQKASSHRT